MKINFLPKNIFYHKKLAYSVLILCTINSLHEIIAASHNNTIQNHCEEKKFKDLYKTNYPQIKKYKDLKKTIDHFVNKRDLSSATWVLNNGLAIKYQSDINRIAHQLKFIFIKIDIFSTTYVYNILRKNIKTKNPNLKQENWFLEILTFQDFNDNYKSPLSVAFHVVEHRKNYTLIHLLSKFIPIFSIKEIPKNSFTNEEYQLRKYLHHNPINQCHTCHKSRFNIYQEILKTKDSSPAKSTTKTKTQLLCGNCRLACYCSTKCQTRSWHGAIKNKQSIWEKPSTQDQKKKAHKAICPKLALWAFTVGFNIKK